MNQSRTLRKIIWLLFLFSNAVWLSEANLHDKQKLLEEHADFKLIANSGEIIWCSKYFLIAHNSYFETLFRFEKSGGKKADEAALPFSANTINIILNYYQNYLTLKPLEISLPIYFELSEAARFLHDGRFNDFIQRSIVNFNNYPAIDGLRGFKEYQNERLARQVLDTIKNQQADPEIEEFIIGEINIDNKIITNGLFEISSSNFFGVLEKKYPYQFSLLQINNLLKVKKWTRKMWSCDIPDELFSMCAQRLFAQIENGLLMKAKELQVDSGEKLVIFATCFVSYVYQEIDLDEFFPKIEVSEAQKLLMDFLKKVWPGVITYDYVWNFICPETGTHIWRFEPLENSTKEECNRRLRFSCYILGLYKFLYTFVKDRYGIEFAFEMYLKQAQDKERAFCADASTNY